jgi:hypothetical protein
MPTSTTVTRLLQLAPIHDFARLTVVTKRISDLQTDDGWHAAYRLPCARNERCCQYFTGASDAAVDVMIARTMDRMGRLYIINLYPVKGSSDVAQRNKFRRNLIYHLIGQIEKNFNWAMEVTINLWRKQH